MAQLKDLLVNGSARVIGNLYADLSGNVLNYGLCETAAGTATKVVNTSGSFNLIDGSKILVLFQNSNTANSPTLNVNGTGAKAIFVDDNNGIPNNFIVGQQYYWFVYNAAKNHWRVAGGGTTQITAIQYGGTNNNSFTSNRPLFFNGTKIIGSTTNYINDTALAINKTSITSGYNFEVNGESLFKNSVVITATTDVGGTTTNKAPLSIGSLTSQHIEIDGNEILAKTNDTTAGTLYLQDGSGYVKVAGSGLGIGGENTSYKLYVNGTSYFNGNATHNGIVYFANSTTYYINNSADGELKDLNVHTLGIKTHPGAGEGISLQGGYKASGFADFGIAYADTGNGGKYGDVQADWATYFTIKRESKPQRGWIWRGDNADTAATMAASLSNRGVFTARAVAADNTYIAFPEGGTATYSDNNKTGMLIIKLPQSKTYTMLRFDIEIYTYERGKKTLATYHVGGYDSNSTDIWQHAQAYSEGIGNLSNLTVRFGKDDSNNVYITIGETTTIWSYPKIAITNLIVGHENATVEKWAHGWQVSIANANPLTSTAFIINEPNLQTEFSGMNLLPNTQYMEEWSGTNYTGLDLPERYCRGKQVSLAGSSTSTNFKDIYYADAFTPEPNTWYTLSFWVKSNLSGDILTYFHPQAVYEGYNNNGKITTSADGAITFTLTENTWQRCWVSWKTTSNVSGEKSIILARVYEVANAKTVTVCLPKLEKGRVPTGWTRNPADAVHLFGSGGDTSYLYNGGGYNANFNNLILHGNLSTGVSGIAFTSQSGNTAINAPSDRAFIQYHPKGVTAVAEGHELTETASGENGRFVIGVGNDATDEVWLQAPGDLGIKHQIGANSYTIADTNNTNWHTAWNNGTTAGPTLNLVMAGIVKTTPAIPAATASVSGIVTTSTQTFGGNKTFQGNITHNGIVYFANGTTYYINNSAVGYLNDLRVNKIRFYDNWIGFYQNANASGSRYGYIQADASYMHFRVNNGNNGFNFNGHLIPSTTNTYDLGSSSLIWRNMYTRRINQAITGGTRTTAGGDKGASADPRYFPEIWTFNAEITPANGDMITIETPGPGHDYGVFLSVNNGTNYYPIVLSGTGRLTTHYGTGSFITLIFDSNQSAASMFALAGQNNTTRITVSGGCWRVVNYYDSGNPGDWNLRQYTIKAAAAIRSGHIIGALDQTGYKEIDGGNAFDIRYAVLYAKSDIFSGGTGNNNFIHHYMINIKNSSNSNISGWTSYKNLYIKGTLNGTIFTPISGNPFVQDITAIDDGYSYYYIGRAYSGNAMTFDTTGQKIYDYRNENTQIRAGNVIQDFTGATVGTANNLNADILGGYWTKPLLDTLNTTVNNHTTLINNHTTSINTINNTNLHVSSDTGTISRASTSYCSQYGSGKISYIIKNGICYISLEQLALTDQATNTKKDHVFTGFPKVKNDFVSFASMAGGDLVGEVFAYKGYQQIVVRSTQATPLFGTLSYIVDFN